ncbi:BQ5605_C008g05320 [Microbotryum silenes-dioicae]|uniref:BQ5605_C008g05320 protein n=1 Tax=Microbotryum silenes-dioicae TaxID=796604 RepID=A0A2X0MGX1_9BASI|nr:BQ5605_C008g05320 [Microbotryum silenes-dioicae]
MDEEDAEMEDGRNKPFNDGAFSEVDSNGRKARKTGLSPNNVAFGQPPSIPPGYPGAYPYPYPYYQPHPLAPSHHHHHHPYPPPRSRSRSTDGRRAQSLDSRPTSAERAPAGGAPRPGPYGYPLPPPPGYHPANPGLHATTPPEGYYPPYGYPPPPGFVGQHSMPPGYYPPPLFGAQAHAQAHVQAQAQASYAHSSQTQSQHPAIAHAQSNSRSRSPATAPTLESGTIGGGNPASTSASAGVTASPPHPSASNSALYPGPRQLPQGYSHSPLGGTNPVPRSQLNGADGRLTLAPLVSNGNRSPRLSDDHATMASDQNGQTERIHLPSVTSISASTAPMMPSVFAPQYPRHRRATSVSSTSAGSVVSTGSAEEGVRSPETNARRTLAAPPPRAQAGTGLAAGRADVPGSPHDERRGRPEKRDRDGTSNNAFSSFKGKGREGAEDLSEIDELEGDTADDDDAFSNGDGRRSMMNVEASLGDLRVDRHRKPHGGAYDGSASPLSSNQNEDSSRSRSSGRGTSREGRGRSRGQYGGGTAGRSAASSASRSKTARQGSASSSMSRSAGSSLSAEAQIRRLKTKVAELTFLNGLMVSRLSQLEGPGRVPLTQSGTMTSLSAETPRPTDDYSEHEQDEEAFRDDPSDGGGDEEMYGDEALREDEELERYGVSVSSQDPAMRQQLLAFVKAQRAQGLSGMSARAET